MPLAATNSSGLVASLVVLVLLGLATMSLAQRNYRLKSVYPWGLRPAWWFAIGFLGGFIGLLLCAIARATSKAQFGSNALDAYPTYPATGSMPSGQYPPPPDAGFSSSYPTAGAYPPPGAPPPPVAYPMAGAYSPPPASAGPLPPAAWQADPMHRHELRYWDGAKWTEHVSDSGTQSTDPL